jgi:hypothetical protein
MSLISTIFTILTTQVGHFTLDNASNNATMLKTLETLLKDRGIINQERNRQVMCYAHVVDLSSGRVIQNLPGAIESYDESEPNELPDTSSVDAAGAHTRNPVALARAVVRAIRGSNTRRAAFQQCILDGNERKTFYDAGELVKVKPLQLLRDVRTRWDSVFFMLERLRELRPVCCHIGSEGLCMNECLLDRLSMTSSALAPIRTFTLIKLTPTNGKP